MKDRIKKFYQDNSEAVVVAAVAIVAGTIGACLTMREINNLSSGKDIVGMQKHIDTDGCTHVVAFLKNGMNRNYIWPAEAQ